MGLNKSAVRFDSERVSRIIPDFHLCWKRIAWHRHQRKIGFCHSSCHFVSSSAARIFQQRFTNKLGSSCHVFTQELCSITCFLFLSLKTILNLRKEGLKRMNSFISKASSITFHWSWNLQLLLLIGRKRGINVIYPGGGAHMAAKVIDLLRDLGLSLPLCKVIFPLQMENKLPF